MAGKIVPANNNNGPIAAATPARITINFLVSGDKALKEAIIVFILSTKGRMACAIIAPKSSIKSPIEFCNCLKPPKPALAAASPAPPYCLANSSKIMVCASANLLDSAKLLITAFCSLEN